jgi:hypothetical protein
MRIYKSAVWVPNPARFSRSGRDDCRGPNVCPAVADTVTICGLGAARVLDTVWVSARRGPFGRVRIVRRRVAAKDI